MSFARSHRIVPAAPLTDAQRAHAITLLVHAAEFAAGGDADRRRALFVELDEARRGNESSARAARVVGAAFTALGVVHRAVAVTPEEQARLVADCGGCCAGRVEQEGQVCGACAREAARARDWLAAQPADDDADPNADSRLTGRDLGLDRAARG